MAFSTTDSGVGPFVHLEAAFTPRRMFVWSGGPPTPALPASGADVDGVSLGAFGTDSIGRTIPNASYLACPGWPVQVETGGSFAAGALLQTDSSGRAIAVSSGKAVLRALQASGGAGAIVWAVWTSGR